MTIHLPVFAYVMYCILAGGNAFGAGANAIYWIQGGRRNGFVALMNIVVFLALMVSLALQ